VGKWKIVSAVVAPWWEDRTHKPDDAEMRSLVGKTITITSKAITSKATSSPNSACSANA